MDAEAGYFINKTQLYKIEDTKLTGRGLSNLVVSVKPRLFYNPATRFEVSCALGANIPFSTTLQQVNYVTLPIDIQPSTGSYGIVFQTYVIKENSFKASRFFFTNRIEKYFKNIHGWEFGTLYLNSVFYSKHYVFREKRIKDWTFILQLRNQIREKNVKDDQTIFASGNVLFFLIPQVNISIQEKWNISVLTDIPLYQHYNEVQLAHNAAFAIALIRDISFGK